MSKAKTIQRDALPELLVVGSVLLVATFLRFYKLAERQLWIDELIQLARFSHTSLAENLEHLRSEIYAAPLDYMLQSILVNWGGPTEFIARAHAALLGSLSVLLFYQIARRLLNRNAALLSTFLWAVFPLHLEYSREGRNYSLFCFLTISSFLILIEALRTQKKLLWLLLAAINALGLYSNYLGVVVIGSQLTFLTVSCLIKMPFLGRPVSSSVVFWGVCSAGGSLLAFFPWWFSTGGGIQPSQMEPVLTWAFWLRLTKELSGSGYVPSIILLVAFIYGVLGLSRGFDGRWLMLACWLVLPVFGVISLIVFKEYIFSIRQVLMATPALVLGAGSGLERLWHQRASAIRVLHILAVLVIATGGLAEIFGKPNVHADWRGLRDYLESSIGPSDRIAAPHVEIVVGYLYPNFSVQRTTLDQIARESTFSLSAPTPGDIHLIETRYVTSQQAGAIANLLGVLEPPQTVRFKGIQIHTWARPLTLDD